MENPVMQSDADIGSLSIKPQPTEIIAMKTQLITKPIIAT